jgi:hypothetical protein
MLGETERKPKHDNEGTHDGDGLVCILKAMKITLRQNVTSINMRLGVVKKSGAEDLQYVLDYDMLVFRLCIALSSRYFAVYLLLYRI